MLAGLADAGAMSRRDGNRLAERAVSDEEGVGEGWLRTVVSHTLVIVFC